jgi:hypothetical protein
LSDTQGDEAAAASEQASWVVLSSYTSNDPVIIGFDTFPETARFTVVAPVEVNEIFPLGDPVAAAVILIKIVVEATDPPVRVRVKELPKPVEAFVEISNPEGAEMLMFAVRSLPDTVND